MRSYRKQKVNLHSPKTKQSYFKFSTVWTCSAGKRNFLMQIWKYHFRRFEPLGFPSKICTSCGLEKILFRNLINQVHSKDINMSTYTMRIMKEAVTVTEKKHVFLNQLCIIFAQLNFTGILSKAKVDSQFIVMFYGFTVYLQFSDSLKIRLVEGHTSCEFHLSWLPVHFVSEHWSPAFRPVFASTWHLLFPVVFFCTSGTADNNSNKCNSRLQSRRHRPPKELK